MNEAQQRRMAHAARLNSANERLRYALELEKAAKNNIRASRLANSNYMKLKTELNIYKRSYDRNHANFTRSQNAYKAILASLQTSSLTPDEENKYRTLDQLSSEANRKLAELANRIQASEQKLNNLNMPHRKQYEKVLNNAAHIRRIAGKTSSFSKNRSEVHYL